MAKAFSMTSKAYAMYLRKSRADVEAERRGEGETLARHRRILDELAQRMNIVIEPSAVYIDLASGDSIAERPDVQRLLSDVQASVYAGVLCMDADRIARGDTIDQGIVAQTFALTDTLIITPTKTYDPRSEADREYFEFSLFMARREYGMIKKRLYRGREASANEGHYLGTKNPYGYCRVEGEDRGPTLAVVPAEAEIVKWIYQEFINGVGATEIARRLNEEGIKTNYGYKWDGGRIRSLIRNPLYVGMIVWAKHIARPRLIDGKKVVERVLNNNPIVARGKHEALVDQATFDTALRLLESRTRGERTHLGKELSNPLAGICICGKCGYAMVRRPATKTSRVDLRCKTDGCPTSSVELSFVIEAVLSTLRYWVDHSAAPAPARIVDRRSDRKEEIKRLRQQIAACAQQMERVYQMLEEGIYSQTEFVNRRAVIELKRREAESRLDELEKAQEPVSPEENMRRLIPRIEHLLEAWDSSSAKEQNEMLRGVISRIVYEKDKRCVRNEDPRKYLRLLIDPLQVSSSEG